MSVRPIQIGLPFKIEGDAFTSETITENPVGQERLMELILLSENLKRALQRVEQNKGAAGVDQMGTNQLRDHLRQHWGKIKTQLLQGSYQPQPVKRVEIPKPGGGKRRLGIPTVLDRFIQQAMLQILQEQWDETFSQFSYGFRPSPSAHQAVKQAQHYVQDGYRWVVDIDLEKFFDRVDHDKLMGIVSQRVKDPRVLRLIRRYLQADVLIDDMLYENRTGTPQGGPLSPLLANLLLDRLDWTVSWKSEATGLCDMPLTAIFTNAVGKPPNGSRPASRGFYPGVSNSKRTRGKVQYPGPWPLEAQPQSGHGFCIDCKLFCKLRVARLAIKTDLINRTAVVRDPYARRCGREGP